MHFLMSFPLNMVLEVAQNQNNQKIKIVNCPTNGTREYLWSTDRGEESFHNGNTKQATFLAQQS